MRAIQVHTRNTETLCMAAREAANIYEPWAKRVTEGRPITVDNAIDRVPNRYLTMMRDSAKRANLAGGTIASLFSAEAYALLCEKSASPFYFWRIVAQAAESARSLPLQVEDITGAIKEVSYRWHIGSALGQTLMKRAFAPNLALTASDELVRMHREGYIVARHDMTFDPAQRSTMEINPLFAVRH